MWSRKSSFLFQVISLFWLYELGNQFFLTFIPEAIAYPEYFSWKSLFFDMFGAIIAVSSTLFLFTDKYSWNVVHKYVFNFSAFILIGWTILITCINLKLWVSC